LKILIADDERIARCSLQSMLEELYPKQHLYFYAEDGVELLDKIHSENPDVAFVDIKMPRMDGLSALKTAREISPETMFLILSGFAEFEFAKQAINLGAKNYLLKPVSSGELSEAMKQLETSSKESIQTDNNHFQLKVITTFNTFQASGPHSAASPLNTPLNMFIFYLDSWNHETRNKILARLTAQLHKLMECFLEKQYRYALFFLTNGELCMIVKKGFPKGHESNLTESISLILSKFERQVTAFSCENNTLENLFNESQQILSSSSIRAVYCYGSVIALDTMERLPNYHQLYEFSESLEKICLAYVEKSSMSFKSNLDNFSKNSEIQKIFKNVDLNSLNCYLDTCLHIKIETKGFTDFICSLCSYADQMFSTNVKEKTDIISQIKQYVLEHYSEQIGINTMSELFDITPNYLSKIFHERAGKKFMDYLTEVRIDNAQKLLSQNPDITIKRVSEMVGYLSAQYFIKIFFKLTGYLPSEYQKRFQ